MNDGESAMLHNLIMFLAPETAPAQATPHSPPAVTPPARRRPARWNVTWKLAASVAGNAVGFVTLLAGCWSLLQVVQALIEL
jgi:hypothetical protein